MSILIKPCDETLSNRIFEQAGCNDPKVFNQVITDITQLDDPELFVKYYPRTDSLGSALAMRIPRDELARPTSSLFKYLKLISSIYVLLALPQKFLGSKEEIESATCVSKSSLTRQIHIVQKLRDVFKYTPVDGYAVTISSPVIDDVNYWSGVLIDRSLVYGCALIESYLIGLVMINNDEEWMRNLPIWTHSCFDDSWFGNYSMNENISIFLPDSKLNLVSEQVTKGKLIANKNAHLSE